MTDSNEPLISVIIPVYNVRNYIDKCIESVMKQTYENLEIILVDDGSTDGSEKKCDEYLERDKRISVIHKENGGLSDARNHALNKISGKFVTFVDSDDYIDLRMIETLYKLIEEYEADVSCVSFQRVFEGKQEKNVTFPFQIATYSGNEAIEDMLYKKSVDTSAWGKLYKASDFNIIRYPIGMIFEDWGTTYKIFHNKNRIVCSSAKMYFYVQRSGSLVHDNFSKKRFDRIVIAKQIFDWANEECVELIDAARARYFQANVQTIREMPLTEQWLEEQEDIKKCIKKYRKDILKDKNIKFIDKLIAVSTYLGIRNLKMLGKIYKLIWP